MQNLIEDPELTRLVRQHTSADAGPFVPCIILNPQLDCAMFLQEDCSYVEMHDPGSNFSILRKNLEPGAGKFVGVIIHNWSKWRKDF